MTEIPEFVVVGNVNQGKSSVVAALTEDASVPIARHPGTTTRAAAYEFKLGQRVVFRIIDSPGFQEARQALAWMRERAASPAERRTAAQAFVDAHRGGERFVDEVELLTPILAGAGVLYVVDASGRFQPSNEAEMEILRWTGQPGMALLNRTKDRDHTSDWTPVLNQFFNLVREFDAHGARFEDRLELLRGFRELRPEWRGAMDDALQAMDREWRDRSERTAAVITDLLSRCLSHVAKEPLGEHESEGPKKGPLEERYLDELRGFEREARAAVERIYGHIDLERRSADLDLLDADLFSDASWRLFGLTRAQLMRSGAAWGAVVGGAIDLMVGGLSFFLGAGIGAGVGALGGWFGGTSVARSWGSQNKMAQVLFPGETGRFLCMGPATNPRFAWVLTDRALLHQRVVRDRAHSRQDALELTPADAADGGKQGVAAAMDSALRGKLDEALRTVTKQALAGRVKDDARERLRAALSACV